MTNFPQITADKRPTPKCGNVECCTSTGIHDLLTFGSGRLDHHGFWEHECFQCEAAYYRRQLLNGFELVESAALNALRAENDQLKADRAARARGYEPGERMPPTNQRVWIEDSDGWRGIAKVDAEGDWWFVNSLGVFDWLANDVVRWWPLPGASDVVEPSR